MHVNLSLKSYLTPQNPDVSTDAHEPHLAVIVPFRGWHRRLADGLEGMHRCLDMHHNYTIFVIEQASPLDCWNLVLIIPTGLDIL